MYPETNPANQQPENYLLAAFRKNPFIRTARYILRRIIAILLTIVIGVFITIVVANHNGMVDQIAKAQVDSYIRNLMWQSGVSASELAIDRTALEAAHGVSLPFWPKHLLYTFKALKLDWGDVADRIHFGMYIEDSSGKVVDTYDSRTIILAKLPNTLLLSGTAYLLMVLIGIPLALFLSQREGHWLDRLTAILSPLSSVPSWVLGILLVVIFAVQFNWFPAGKMVNSPPPQTTWDEILQVSYHMVLPVASIVLSLIFQLVNNWRTFLLIYSEEDYVDLAKAKGLSPRVVEWQYILRPVLPYLLTGLALTLVGFWQTITALEYFFDWPGIGKLYVNALPHFKGEHMYSGEMSIMVGIVVLFAYLLGITVFLLDFIYVVVDPRLRLGEDKQQLYATRQKAGRNWLRSLIDWFRKLPLRLRHRLERIREHPTRRFSFRHKSSDNPLHRARSSIYNLWHEISRSPGAVVGLSLISLLVIFSIGVVVFMPYGTIGREWETTAVSTNPTRAKLALPKWVNWFRKNDLPSTIILDSREGGVLKQVTQSSSGMTEIQLEYTFEYPYQDFPSDMVLYVDPVYKDKVPFLTLTWITADSREIQLKSTSVTSELTYAFSENVQYRRELLAHPNLKNWFVTSGNYPTPAYYLLMTDPDADEAKVMPGIYTLRVNATFFEPGGDLDAKLVVFGLVEGWAGTDNLRRDLMVPLLWGLPIALIVGGIGSIATTLLSILIAAAAAWFGGGVDAFIERAIEANLILPILAIGVLFNAYYGFNLWVILALMVALNVLGSPTKAFRAAFLQVKNAEYIEAARVYGASNWRIIRKYLIPRILPVIIPQIVTLIPNFFFLEATLAIFNISDPRYPTWGRVIYSGLRYGGAYGSRFWVLEPITLMLLTGFSFVLLGFALNRILNPRLRDV
jgi:peptide/nickel transport system permease protein